MFFIPVVSCTQGFQCEEHDVEMLSRHKWRSLRNAHHQYVRTTIDGKTVLAHRLIVGLDACKGLVVDHINGNGFDNRRSNLSVVSAKENTWNRRLSHAQSGIAGVKKVHDSFHAKFVHDGETVYLDAYEIIEEAAFHVLIQKRKLRGEFAVDASFDKEKLRAYWLNKIDGLKTLLSELEGL